MASDAGRKKAYFLVAAVFAVGFAAGANIGIDAPPSVFLKTTFTFCPIRIVSRSQSTMLVIIFTPSSKVT